MDVLVDQEIVSGPLADDPKVVDEGDDRLAVLERRLELALAHPGRLVLVAGDGAVAGHVLRLVVKAAAHDVSIDVGGGDDVEDARQEYFLAGSSVRAGDLDVDLHGNLRVLRDRGRRRGGGESERDRGRSEKRNPMLVPHDSPSAAGQARSGPAGLQAKR